jgi:hypothetical protein
VILDNYLLLIYLFIYLLAVLKHSLRHHYSLLGAGACSRGLGVLLEEPLQGCARGRRIAAAK